MPISAQCPECSAKINVPDTLAGKKIRCAQCGKVMSIAGGNTLGGGRLPSRASRQTKAVPEKSSNALLIGGGVLALLLVAGAATAFWLMRKKPAPQATEQAPVAVAPVLPPEETVKPEPPKETVKPEPVKPTPPPVETPGSRSVGMAEIEESIDQGVTWLKSQQEPDGHWVYKTPQPNKGMAPGMPALPMRVPSSGAAAGELAWVPAGHELGMTSLAAMTLIECGVPRPDPIVQGAASYVRSHWQENKDIYDVSLTVLFLNRLGDRQDRSTVAQLARRILFGQLPDGGWHYTLALGKVSHAAEQNLSNASRPTINRNDTADNSTTQFGVMGLWAASRSGVKISPAMVKVDRRFRASQNKTTGGWNYANKAQEPDTSSMTAAGLFTIIVARADQIKAELQKHQGKAEEKANPVPRLTEDPAFLRAKARIAEYVAAIGPADPPYYLYGLERIAAILDIDKFDQADWYQKGADALVKTQTSTGTWARAQGLADDCFCLLFLHKSRMNRDIAFLIAGDRRKPFSIVERPPAGEFATLQEAIAAAKPDETVLVRGHGPFEFGSLDLKKPLTVRAATGFDPIFRSTIAREQGIGGNAGNDARTHWLIGSLSPLTVEGIRLEMNPLPGGKAKYAVFHVEKAPLRLLNCTLIETSKAGTAMIDAAGGAPLTVRNCLLYGSGPAIRQRVDGPVKIEMANDLVYATTGIELRKVKGVKAAASASLFDSTFQGTSFLELARMAGPLSVRATGNIFVEQWMAAHLMPEGVQAQRKWEGRRNVYHVSRWLSNDGQEPLAGVENLNSWSAYWGRRRGEKDSQSTSVPFVKSRIFPSFESNPLPQDWSLQPGKLTVPGHVADLIVGCDTYTVGSGAAYEEFRDSPDYEEKWLGAERKSTQTASMDQAAHVR